MPMMMNYFGLFLNSLLYGDILVYILPFYYIVRHCIARKYCMIDAKIFSKINAFSINS